MKSLYSGALSFFALLLTLAPVVAQTARTTIPVGLVKITIPAAPNANTLSSLAISAPLYGNAVYQGAIVSIDSATTLTLSNANFTAGQYAASPYFARIMSGTSVGRFFLITTNSINQLTVDTAGADLTTLLSPGDIAQIVPANTLGSLFGATAPGFVTGISANTADNVFLWIGGTWEVYYNDGTHWHAAGSLNPNLDATIIYPDEGVFISHRSTTSPLVLHLAGTVPSTPEQSDLPGAGSTLLPNRFPVDVQLINIGLQNSPNWKSGITASQADNVYVWSTASETWNLFYYNGTHWRESGSLIPNLDATIIPAGTSVFVTRANTTPAFVTQPLPYTP